MLQLAGLPLERNFNSHSHRVSLGIPMGIPTGFPMGIPMWESYVVFTWQIPRRNPMRIPNPIGYFRAETNIPNIRSK